MRTKIKRSLIGVDLGQSQDFTAINVIEKVEYIPYNNQGERKIYYHIRHLERVPLGTSYPAVVERVSSIENKLKKPLIVIDYTGVGRPVYDMFREANLQPYGISITGGDTVSQDGRIYHVPKRDLAGVLQLLYQQGRIKVAAKLPQARILNDELLNFRVKIDPQTGHDSYEHRSGKHDDLVLSIACACWLGERRKEWGWNPDRENPVY